MVAKRDGGVELDEKGEGIKKYKLAVTKWSRGCKIQHSEYGQRYYVWCREGTRLIGGPLHN